MPDIFISYSRKDAAQVELLAEKFTSNGLSCWIDKQGIIGAEKWAQMIVDGIRSCSTFVVLISSASVESEHVLKELSLASERRKRILPVDLEPVELPSAFEYLLAGLQRVAISDFNGILRSHKHGVERVFAKDARKSLMILPFEDLSPSKDNEWFADGLTSELIGALSNIKALRLIDWNTSKLFREHKVKTVDLARELDVQYFIEGQVRKFGEQIKISVTLLDIATHEHLWHASLRGEMKDIFDIQEQVSQNVVDGLKLHLTNKERQKLKERGTENEEAFALSKQAVSYAERQTMEGMRHAIELLTKTIELDDHFAEAKRSKAYILCEIFRVYDRNPEYLREAEQLAKYAIDIHPEFHRVYGVFSSIYRLQGKLAEAEEAAKEYIRRMPDEYWSHFSLGYFYMETLRSEEAIPCFERALELKPGDLTSYFNLFVVAEGSGNRGEAEKWSRAALPHFEKHLRLLPDDETARVWYTFMLHYAGKPSEAEAMIQTLLQKKHLDPGSLYNIASYYATAVEPPQPEAALTVLRRSIGEGFAYRELIEQWRDMEWVKSDLSYGKQLDEIIASVN